MFRTLLGKEWRQLRQLRWAAAGVTLFMPPFLLALVAAGERGWLVAQLRGSSASVVVEDVLPLTLALAIWPLLALMIAAQALVADRAAGTDEFLLGRPVPRSRIWLARMSTGIGTTLAVVAFSTLVWWVFVRMLGNTAHFDEMEALGMLWLRGGLAVLVTTLAGFAASAFVRSSMQAVLLGLVLTAIPVSIGALFQGRVFWAYRIQGFPVGTALPALLLIGYLVGSFVAECRGEPAGRGRVRRGVSVLAAALVSMPVLFAASAPLVMRLDARLGLGNTRVIPAPASDRALVLNEWQRAAWLIDTASAHRLRFFTPPVFNAAWNESGTKLALVHATGVAGRFTSWLRIEVLDPEGSRLREPIECGECREWWDDDLYWTDDRIVLPGFAEGRECLLIVDPTSGARHVVTLPRPAPRWTLLQPVAGGDVYVLLPQRGVDDPSDTDSGRRAGALHRVDVAGARLENAVIVPDFGRAYFTRGALSPSGRFWLRRPTSRGEQVRVLDLASGETIDLPSRQAVWLDGDDLAWVEADGTGNKALHIGPPGESRRIRTFDGKWFNLEASPDGRRLLIGATTAHRVFGRWLLDLDTERWTELPVTPDHDWFGAVQWADTDKLALVEPGALALFDPETPDDRTYLIGDGD